MYVLVDNSAVASKSSLAEEEEDLYKTIWMLGRRIQHL